MKKLFLAICFNLLMFSIQPTLARVTPVSGYASVPQPQTAQNVGDVQVTEMPYDEFATMLKDNFEQAQVADANNINHMTDAVPSAEEEAREEEAQKGFFQKVYENALKRVSTPQENKRADVATPMQQAVPVAKQREDWQENNISTIQALLPSDTTPVAVPAVEHIPYLMNSIEVLPSGLVKFEETVVVVADGTKLRHGLTKILPIAVYNGKGEMHRLNYSVIGVAVNDMPVDYHLTRNGDNVLLVPNDDYQLLPGIYTYKFEYVVDNLLWPNDKSYIFYWNVGGNGWNLVVDRLGVSLNLPQQGALLDAKAFLGVPPYIEDNPIEERPNGLTAKAYIAKRPLFIGEGMHLIAAIDSGALLPASGWQKFVRKLYDKGDIIVLLFGAGVILLSFVVSWRFILKDKGLEKISVNKTAAMVRELLFNRFDMKSVCGYLLEWYKKNIIDIQQSDSTILLIKRTDNMRSLQPFEQKALHKLFPHHETVFNVSEQNKLPFKRMIAVLEKGAHKQLWRFKARLESGYFLLSLAMLLLTEYAMASFKVDASRVFEVLVLTTLMDIGAVSVWLYQGRRWLKYILRLLSVDVLLLGVILFSAVIEPISAFLLSALIIGIMKVLQLYVRRQGLIRHYITDLQQQREHLLKQRDNIILGKSFLNYQALIWAFNLEDDFVPAGEPEFYKIAIVKQIIQRYKA
jgi:hypothetical protein